MLIFALNKSKSQIQVYRRVSQSMQRAARTILMRFGAFVRQRAKTSIRKRKKISLPGHPPSSHEGGLRRGIFFVYDPIQLSVTIGPVKYPGTPGEAPNLLEFGGTAKRRGRFAVYRKRPYMGPAFEAELPQFPELWRNSIKR